MAGNVQKNRLFTGENSRNMRGMTHSVIHSGSYFFRSFARRECWEEFPDRFNSGIRSGPLPDFHERGKWHLCAVGQPLKLRVIQLAQTGLDMSQRRN